MRVKKVKANHLSLMSRPYSFFAIDLQMSFSFQHSIKLSMMQMSFVALQLFTALKHRI